MASLFRCSASAYRFALATLLAATSFASAPTETAVQYLSGRGNNDGVLWDFYCTAGRNSGEWRQIRVPSCWETEGYGVYEYGMEHYRSEKTPNPVPQSNEQGKYRRTFTVPAEWRGRTVQLTFDGVMTDADVRVNGVPAGPIHEGAFYRFSFDITALLKWDAPNSLEVTVSKLSANVSVNHAERIADYWNFGGIFRPVFLTASPVQYISHAAIDARADGSFRAELELAQAAKESGRISGQIFDSAHQPVGNAFNVDVAAGATRATLTGRIENPQLWTAEDPHLYRVKLSLRGATSELHVREARFGFRTFEVRAGDGLYLNGRKIILKGVNRHSFWPESGRTLNRELCYADVRLMKAANMNAVRMSHYPPEEEFLEACDELGLYVLDELGGWHGKYDTPTGRKLIAEMIRRDVNHPSILFWDNGNEGGENIENDGEFAKHDPQNRPVLHPWGIFSGINTSHYRPYDETLKFSAGPEIFMPTEFLHGIYDGGHGAGLEDYWKLMGGGTPFTAGGFLWVWADEAVSRVDEGGRLDARRHLAPDGIVGPHHEPEASYFTAREIWSPVQIALEKLPDDFDGKLAVENRYDFLSLAGCTFEWSLARFPKSEENRTGHQVTASGAIASPDIPSRGQGEVKIPLPADWRFAEALYLTAKDRTGLALCTWAWHWTPAKVVSLAAASGKPIQLQQVGNAIEIKAGPTTIQIDRTTGQLVQLSRGANKVSLAKGPRLAAYRRVDRTFEAIPGQSTLRSLTPSEAPEGVTITCAYDGPLSEVVWRVSNDGEITLEYAATCTGKTELFGVEFDYPQANILSKTWLGAGPYRVWQNRRKGPVFDVWSVAFNDPEPGVSWAYPEFKGWFRDWQWLTLTTTEGRLAFINESGVPHIGLYTPRDGRENPVLKLPATGIGFYHVIPAIGTKTARPDELGPQSQPQVIDGVARGSVRIRLLDTP